MSELKSSVLKITDKLQTGAKTVKKHIDVAEIKMRECMGNDEVKGLKKKFFKKIKELVNLTETKKSKDVHEMGKLLESQEKVMSLEPFNPEVAEIRTDNPDYSTSDASVAAPSEMRSYNGFSKKSKALLMNLEKQEEKLYEIIIPQLDEIESSERMS